MQDNSYQHCAL